MRKIKTMDLILLIVFLALFVFTVAMIITFNTYNSIPDTLCTCVFSALGGECGVMGIIKSVKIRNANPSESEDG